MDNRTDGVFVSVEGEEKDILNFRNQIMISPPEASNIKTIEVRSGKINGYHDFTIALSKNTELDTTEISPDIAVCHDCLEDLESDPERINYPFVNCTNCGPRFTIIEKLPYDRQFTSMERFQMCPDCEREYHDTDNRRFHAQPVACNKCGPEYELWNDGKIVKGIEEILSTVAEKIRNGETIAIKGMGGYNLVCDALNEEAVSRLRERKYRDSKPFAVLFRNIDCVKDFCYCSKEEESALKSWKRPIVILQEKKKLAPSLSKGLNTTGALLPYMPFHYLLLNRIKSPAIVLTSGNFSEEPIVIDDRIASKKFPVLADSIVSHNRQILNRCDDSVVRVMSNEVSILRRSRGYVPLPVDLPFDVGGILSVGADQKNTFCLGKGKQAVMSQYIGDLKNLPTFEFFKESVDRFSKMFNFKPVRLACDLHPDYISSNFAEQLSENLKIPLIRVQHHHAHIASCMAENQLNEKVIGICMDGTGFGDDGNIWGGEFLLADLKGYERFAHFDYVPMPGGDKAADEPWRMAFSYLFKYFGDSSYLNSIPAFQTIPDNQVSGIREVLRKNINCPLSSGAGRLFDAVSSIMGICNYSGFDSEAPIRLESVASYSVSDHYPFHLADKVVFDETIKSIINDLQNFDISVISAKFHNTIAMAIAEMAMRMREETSLNKVVLSGGVFQNKYLFTRLCRLLVDRHFEIFSNHSVPSNDGGVSLGQIVIASNYK